jgi:6,7-dimethyl-8-ribityllumazine synthase
VIEIVGNINGKQKKIGIVISRFNESITKALLKGALETLRANGVAEEHIAAIWVPGAFEIPFMAMKLAKTGRFDAVICLGAVIRGETPHFDYVAKEAAAGIAQASLKSGIPMIFGVLTTDTVSQAIERADPLRDNKGGYAAKAALEMIDLTDRISSLALQSV